MIKGLDLRDILHQQSTHQEGTQLKHPYLINSIYNIKNKSPLHVIVANYTNKHVTFNKGQCIGKMELPINSILQTSVNSVITQKMMDKQVQ